MEERKAKYFALVELYKAKEREFYYMEGSLCEDVSPFQCDCSKCPTFAICQELDELERRVSKEEREIFGGKWIR